MSDSVVDDDALAPARPQDLQRRWIRQDGGPWLPVTILSFDAAAFDPAAFHAARLALPASIARSVPRRQAEFFFGRLAARIALAAAGQPEAPVAIGAMREPVWPVAVVGSITHAHAPSGSHSLAAAVVSGRTHYAGVGVDIEFVVANESAASALQAAAVDGDELAILRQACPDLADDLLLTLAFSAKESLYKAVFETVRDFVGFDAGRVVALDPAGGRVTLALARTLGSAFVRGRRCDVGFEFLEPGAVLTSFAWR